MSNLSKVANNQLAQSKNYKNTLQQTDTYRMLNGRQWEAVSSPLESFLVLAGAGTGKTSVLIKRIQYLITELKVDPTKIMGVTFTNKAAKEIRSRLFYAFKDAPEKANGPVIGTFHSICFKLVRQYSRELGIAENYAIWDEDDISDWLVKFVRTGYDRPQELMSNEELIAYRATQQEFIMPVEQVQIIKESLERAVEKVKSELNHKISLKPEMERTEAERSQINMMKKHSWSLQNALDYYEFFSKIMSGKKTMEFREQRFHIGRALFNEIGIFKENGWESNKASEHNQEYFDSFLDPEVGHYIPKFMLSDFDHKKAFRYLALVTYRDYELYSRDNHLLDFSDLLLLSVKLLEENEHIRYKVQQSYKAILVDEFQDTNMMQYRWLKLLAGEDNTVMVVGDDDQSIYGWRGAHPEYMEYFLYDFKKPLGYMIGDTLPETFMARKREVSPLKIVKLEQNYRSTANILEAANKMIALNPDRLGKTLYTKNNRTNDLIDVISFDNEDTQAKYIAADIKRLINESLERNRLNPDEPVLTFADFAVLYRRNITGTITSSAFTKANVPNLVFGGFNFYQRKVVKNALEWLNFIVDLENDLLFTKTFNQIPPKKRVNPFAQNKSEQGFTTKLIEILDFERKNTGVPRYIDALISRARRFDNEWAVLNNDFSEADDVCCGMVVNADWHSPYATNRGFITAEFHHTEKERAQAKSISDYMKYINRIFEVVENEYLSLSEVVKQIWETCGLWSYYELAARAENEQELLENKAKKGKTTNAKKAQEAEKDLEHLNELYESIKSWEQDNLDDNNEEFKSATAIEKLAMFLNDIALLTDIENKDQVPSVRLMTIHGAKGLEFKRVYLISVSKGFLPLSTDEEEERRLFYVGITRAREHLTITSIGTASIFMRELNDYCSNIIDNKGTIGRYEVDRIERSVDTTLLDANLIDDKKNVGMKSLQRSNAQRISDKTEQFKGNYQSKGNIGNNSNTAPAQVASQTARVIGFNFDKAE